MSNTFFLISALVFQKKVLKVPSKLSTQKMIFLNRSIWPLKNQITLISDLTEYFRKKCNGKHFDPKTVFLGTWHFLDKKDLFPDTFSLSPTGITPKLADQRTIYS
jgi:hypothetical protein